MFRTYDEESVVFERKYTNSFPNWETEESVVACNGLIIDEELQIENSGVEFVQMDFANKHVGGGVLTMGCVQEEIRFLISPELIVSMLFCETLNDYECLLVTGVERFSDYSGYSNNFKFRCEFIDNPNDYNQTTVLVLDALHFTNPMLQYQSKYINRELNKLFVGFSSIKNKNKVATGNWGCGAFRGDPKLKAILQIIVSSYLGLDLLYCTFKDVRIQNLAMVSREILLGKPIATIYKEIVNFGQHNDPNLDLFEFLGCS